MVYLYMILIKFVLILQEEQLQQVRDLLLKDKRSQIAEETKEKLSFLQSNRSSVYRDGNGAGAKPELSAIQEVNTTGKMRKVTT